MRIYKQVSSLLFIAILISCSKAPSLTGFNADEWKDDLHGCHGKRQTIIDTVLSQRAKLLSLDEMEVAELLGKPDAHEIYKRSEKFFYYSVRGDSSCGETAGARKRLVIRFNAVGLSKEVTLEE